MRISDIRKIARDSLRGKWGLAIGITVLAGIIVNGIPKLLDLLFGGGIEYSTYSYYIEAFHYVYNVSDGVNVQERSIDILKFLCSLLLFPITIGTSWVYLRFVRDESAKVSDIFIPFLDIMIALKIILTNILIVIFTILWTFLFIIPGIIKSFSYSQTYYILRDHPELTPLEAITKSREMMNGYKWKYFLLNLSFIGWIILSIFTLFIGLLWILPYIGTANAAFYDELRDKRKIIDLEKI